MDEQQMYELGVEAARTISLERTFHLTAFAVGFEDQTIAAPDFSACHGWFYRLSSRKPRAMVMANQINMKRKDFEKAKGWYDYLLNDSPFHHAYLSKDVNKIYDDGVIVRLDLNNNYVIAAGIATRHPWEFETMVSTWEQLLKYGMNRRKAFLLQFLVTVVTPTRVLYEPKGGHSSFYPLTTSDEGIQDFLNHRSERVAFKEPKYCDVHRYAGIPGMWGAIMNNTGDRITKKIKMCCNKNNDPGINPFPCIDVTDPRIEVREPLKELDNLLEEYMQ